jgi:hypothetical protein
VLHPDWIRDNRLLVPIVVAEQHNKGYPNVPARQTIDLVTVTQKLDRPILAPPNTPPEQLLELRTALAATARDPGFLAETRKKNLTIDRTGAEANDSNPVRFSPTVGTPGSASIRLPAANRSLRLTKTLRLFRPARSGVAAQPLSIRDLGQRQFLRIGEILRDFTIQQT